MTFNLEATSYPEENVGYALEGLIDEFGSVVREGVTTGPLELGTIFFRADDVNSTTEARIFANPADNVPFESTLLSDRPDPLTDNQIDFNALVFNIIPSAFDFGDAPDSYSTTSAAGGPRHLFTPDLMLGSQVDTESDGNFSASGTGDDVDNLDDEDGVTFLTPLLAGESASVQLTALNSTGSTGFLQGWVDFNGSGTFDASEQVFTDVQLAGGTTQLDFDVPASAQVGSTFARFRYSLTAGLGVSGQTDSGEVEDYQVNIESGLGFASDDVFTVSRELSLDRSRRLGERFPNTFVVTDVGST